MPTVGYTLMQIATGSRWTGQLTIVNGQAKAPSLKDACHFFGVEYPENAHRALEDARVSALIATKSFPMWREISS